MLGFRKEEKLENRTNFTGLAEPFFNRVTVDQFQSVYGTKSCS